MKERKERAGQKREEMWVKLSGWEWWVVGLGGGTRGPQNADLHFFFLKKNWRYVTTGAFQEQNTFAATLHYQLAYRLQNHAFDMVVPNMAQSNDALLIQVDSGMTPMCTFVPILAWSLGEAFHIS